MSWPRDKDGALLERLKRHGINFSKLHWVEFNVDFQQWPPPSDVIHVLREKYRHVKVFEPGQLHDMQDGYISLRIKAKVSYRLVLDMQHELTGLVTQYGGYCNSWAILHHQADM